MEAVAIDIGDGFLFISETAQCRYYIEYDNKLAPAPAIVTQHNFDTLEMVISRGAGREPDTLIVFDTVTKASYSITVEEFSTGRTCVPWPLMG